MKKFLLFIFLMFMLLSPANANNINQILHQYSTKDYIVIGPKKIKVDGDYLTYYQYPNLKKLYIYDIEFLREIGNLKVFKGYIIKEKLTGKILILPVGEYHESKND